MLRAREEDGDKTPAKRRRNTGITAQRYRTLETLVGRALTRLQGMAKMHKDELLGTVNEELGESGEDAFTEEELQAGLEKLEEKDKIMSSEDGYVELVS